MTRASTVLLAIAIASSGGCVLALPGYNEPFEERLAIIAPHPGSYEIALDGSEVPPTRVPSDGKTVLHFPVLPRHCSTFFLGIKVKDRSVAHRKLILLLRDGRVVRKLSVDKLRSLPVDPAGYHQLRLR